MSVHKVFRKGKCDKKQVLHAFIYQLSIVRSYANKTILGSLASCVHVSVCVSSVIPSIQNAMLLLVEDVEFWKWLDEKALNKV